jgi:voltage-gated potassium channel
VNGPADAQPDAWRRLRRRVYELLDPSLHTFWDRLVHNALIVLVLVNVGAVVLESVPSIAARRGELFWVIEVVSLTVFTAEYLLRLWTAVEEIPLTERSPWAARLAWARSPAAIVDLVAILPFYLLLFEPADLRVFALLRLVRFFKLLRYSSGLASLFEAIYAERHALLASFLILSSLILIMATLMHLAERGAQPDRYGTIPDAMWWAVVTLTTVGYGDVVPITPLGKIIAGLTAIMGFTLLALPVGIIATSFAEVIHRREFVVTWTMVARVPIFSNLGAGEIAEIMQLLDSRTARKGEVIARRGEKAEAIYFIVSGTVEVELVDGETLRLQEGEFFGEIAILTGEDRTATVRACGETQLLVLEAHDLERLMNRVPEIGRRIREIAHTRAPDRVDRGDAPRKPMAEPPEPNA